MPKSFERRKNNRTRVSKKEDRIFWHYSIDFKNLEGNQQIIAKNSVDGSLNFKQFYKINKIDYEDYDIYLADMSSGKSRSGKSYKKLDKNLSINHAIEGMTILEFP